jgi:hypothetical protein
MFSAFRTGRVRAVEAGATAIPEPASLTLLAGASSASAWRCARGAPEQRAGASFDATEIVPVNRPRPETSH